MGQLNGRIGKENEEHKIRILFGITLSETGGAQKVLFDIISSLPEEKYDITLVTSPGGQLIEWVKKLNEDKNSHIKIITLQCLKRQISFFSDIKAFCILYKIIRSDRYDIVHFHSSKMGILGRCAAWLARVPNILFTVHGWGINDYMPFLYRRIFGFAERIAGKLCTRVVCVSENDMEKGIKNKWVDKSKVCVVHNGIDDYKVLKGELREKFDIPYCIPIIGTVSRLSEPKQPLFAINVVRELKNRGHKLKYIIIGDGPMMEECLKLVCRLQLQTDVILIGERDDVRSLIQDFNVFTLFSRWEGLPVTIIEAMFARLPVVASNIGGVPELVENGVNGYLIDEFDISRAADCIERLLNSGGLRIRMGYMGRERAQRYFTKLAMVSKYQHLYSWCMVHSDSFKRNKEDKILKSKAISLFGRETEQNSPGEKGQPIGKKFSWVFLGNSVYALSKGLLIMLVAKFGTVEMVGQFALAIAVTTPVFMLSNLNLRMVLTTDAQGRYRFVDYFHLRAATSVFGIFICCTIVFVLNLNFQQSVVILFMAASKGVESLSDIILGMLQRSEVMDKIGKSMTIKAFGTVVLMCLGFLLTGSLIMGTVGIFAGFLVVFIFYDIWNIRVYMAGAGKVRPAALWHLMKTSLPLGILQAFVSLNSYMPGYFIQEYRGTQALGYYSSIAYLITMGEMINISLGQSIIPRLSKYYAAGQKGSFFRTLVIIIAASTGIGIAGLVIVTGAGPLILSIIYTRDYAPYWNIQMLLMIAACFQYIGGSLSNALSSARKFNYLPALYGIVTAINIVFLMVLVPSKGLEGAAYAVIVSSYAHLFGNLLVNIFTL